MNSINPIYPNPPEDIQARNFFSPQSEEYRLLKDLIISELAFSQNALYCPIHHSIESKSEGSRLRHVMCSNVHSRTDFIGKIL